MWRKETSRNRTGAADQVMGATGRQQMPEKGPRLPVPACSSYRVTVAACSSATVRPRVRRRHATEPWPSLAPFLFIRSRQRRSLPAARTKCKGPLLKASGGGGV